ncbi:unnamed protein product [Rotaria magnacalcarata]|uniref:F-box domain-containing protein n=1 Tax=Rotaria magnacalcarata TaxID=392030 RepID=A0A815RLJ1_9BILA|nr:unnamed protein product [Rotaria magnacalcarata]CAF4831075.1 unnamed protein product [Rotaria magnacalcarata]
MSTEKKSNLETLPVEPIHRIFDALDSETILFSIRFVYKRLYSSADVYNQYKLDFRYLSKSDLPLLARIIDPKNVVSLMISDEIETYGQIGLFLSHFRLHEFIRLDSLTLIKVKDKDLDTIQKYIKKHTLTTISISSILLIPRPHYHCYHVFCHIRAFVNSNSTILLTLPTNFNGPFHIHWEM